MVKLRRQRISKRTVDSFSAEGKDAVFWDSELQGFGVRVYPTGSKVYIVQTRSGGKSRRFTLGRRGMIGADEARHLWSSPTCRPSKIRPGRRSSRTFLHFPFPVNAGTVLPVHVGGMPSRRQYCLLRIGIRKFYDSDPEGRVALTRRTGIPALGPLSGKQRCNPSCRSGTEVPSTPILPLRNLSSVVPVLRGAGNERKAGGRKVGNSPPLGARDRPHTEKHRIRFDDRSCNTRAQAPK